MTNRRWQDLSPRKRRLIVVGAIADGTLRIAALVDLRRRPADQVRGSKKVWAPALALVNSAGLLPLAYFLRGRRTPPGPPLTCGAPRDLRPGTRAGGGRDARGNVLARSGPER